VIAEAATLRGTADALAELDVLAGWAALAREWDYCRPELDESDVLEIAEGRHPVVEQMLKSERNGLAGRQSFVPNDALLASEDAQILLITGPNMAGKSTYIRQVALIALLAQIGCWVPAKRCRVGLVDRIFSRVGASDDLARGNSTFMVEMNETANILNNTTDRSLIILDEIGRGTATYDGLAIAWAVVEFIHQHSRAKTLFATHYHELTELEELLDSVKNYHVSVKEAGAQFLRFARVGHGLLQVLRPEDVFGHLVIRIIEARLRQLHRRRGALRPAGGHPRIVHQIGEAPDRIGARRLDHQGIARELP